MNLERMFARGIVCLAAIAFAFSAGAAETRINAIGEKSREEIVVFFSDNEFGRRPAEAEKPPLLKFEKVSDDKLMARWCAIKRASFMAVRSGLIRSP